MIFVTVGTHHQRFDRLLGALEPLAELDDLVVQHGNGPAPPAALLAAPFMGSREVAGYIARAAVVVSHAGVGSIVLARRAGHVPVVVPRRRAYGEHVDDHQVELVRALERRGQVIAVWDVAQLAGAVRSAPPAGAAQVESGAELHTALRRVLQGVG